MGGVQYRGCGEEDLPRFDETPALGPRGAPASGLFDDATREVPIHEPRYNPRYCSRAFLSGIATAMLPPFHSFLRRLGLPPRSIHSKVALMTMMVVLLPLLGTTLFGTWLTSDLLRDRALRLATENLEKQAREVRDFLDNARQDVHYLAQLYSMRQLLYARHKGQVVDAIYWRTQLGEDFRIFARTHPTYYQIRYLDVNGDEVVRVNQPLGQSPYIVPDTELQNKAHRYYFQEAAHLTPGQMYVSPLDLNREHHAVERPLHPVLRYATPLYWKDQWLGVLVVNLHAQPLLNLLHENDDSAAAGGDTLLVDSAGYYLFHPNPSKRWGSSHDLDTGESLWRDAPDVAKEVLSGRKGVVYREDEVWVYTPIYPAEQEAPDYYWVLIRREPQAQLFAVVEWFRTVAGGVFALAVLLAAIMALGVARIVTRPVLRLKEAVERFGQGEMDVRVPVDSDDELAHLAAAFNRMAAAIHRDMRQLQLLNRGATALTRQLDLCQALHTAAEAVARLFDAPWVAVYRVDAEHVWHDTSAHYGPAPALAEPTVVPGWDAEQVVARGPALVGEGMWWTVRLQGAHDRRYVLCFAEPENVEFSRAQDWIAVLVHQAETVLKNIQLYVTLRKHRQQLSELLSRVITAQEEERKLVAYDLHDGLIQVLVGARLHLNNFVLLHSQDPAAARDALQRAVVELQRAIQEGRRLIQGLRPTVLDDLGLAMAVREVAEGMGREQGWRLELGLDVPGRLSPAVEITAFRIVQEALSNVRKHARAQRVVVRLWIEQNRLHGLVQDDGQGFDPALYDEREEGGAVGLHSMRERARLIGGGWRVESRVGQGATVHFWIPLTPEEDGHA